MRFNRKIILTTIFFVMLGPVYSYAGYDALTAVPEVIQGDAEIISTGVNPTPDSYSGDIYQHQVTFRANVNSLYNGINLVEYTPTNEYYVGKARLFWQSQAVKLVILPGMRQKAFVLVRERQVDNAYKVTFDAIYHKITVEQIKDGAVTATYNLPYNVKVLKRYKVEFYFGYESSGGQGGDRVIISEISTNALGSTSTETTILNKKLWEIGLQLPSTCMLFRLFVGSDRANASFTNEVIKGIDY